MKSYRNPKEILWKSYRNPRTSWFLGAPPRGATGGHGGHSGEHRLPAARPVRLQLCSPAPRSPLGGPGRGPREGGGSVYKTMISLIFL